MPVDQTVPGEVVVDETATQTSGNARWYRTSRCGTQGGTTWARSTVGVARNQMTWIAQLQPGNYEVFVYVPRCIATTRRAHYQIQTASGHVVKTINQQALPGGWTSLGVFSFGAQGAVTLGDETGENFRRVAFDAVKWVPFSVGSQGTPQYAISGRVTTAGGAGLAGVSIRLADGTTASTDAGGNYTLANLPGGVAYTLTPDKAGYAFNAASKTVTLDANVTGVNFVATSSAPSPTPYAVTGRVTQNGAGLAGVWLQLSNGSPVVTDAGGNYAVAGLTGTVTLSITPRLNGYAFNPPARTVTASAALGGQDFSASAAPAGFSISGRVAAPDGQPLAGLPLTLSPGGATSTDANGNYTFPNLTAGETFTITATDARYRYSPSYRRVIAAAGVNFPVTGQDFTATLKPTSVSISGRVTVAGGGGLAGVTLSATGGPTVLSDANGYYTLSGLTPGVAYTVTPSKAGYRFDPSGRTTTTSQDVTGRDFTAIDDAFSLAGRVTDASGGGVGGALVTLSNGQSAATDADGHYGFSNLTPGTYTLRPSLAGRTFDPSVRYVVAHADVAGQDFVVVGTPAP